MALFAALIMVGSMVMATYHYWCADAVQRREKDPLRPFLQWVGKGLGVPLLIWTFFNSGLLISPFLPQIAQAQAAGSWAGAFISFTSGVLFVVASWWVAVTLGWISWRILARSETRTELLATAGVWMLPAGPIALLLWAALGRMGSGVAAALCFAAITQAMMPLAREKAGPTYSKALAKIARDKFNEAEWEIIQQLEQAENDFDGWMLLAELYAMHFRDLASAERTVCELCDDPNTPPPQIAIALNRLADWHLKLANNPADARWALEQLCERLPETHMARMAETRIRQLPASREDCLMERKGRTLKLSTPAAPLIRMAAQTENDTAPTLQIQQPVPAPAFAVAEAIVSKEPDAPARWSAPTVPLAPPAPKPVIDSKAAALDEANACVKLLEANPNDVATRERFAQVLAERLGKVDLALEQLDLLLTMPGQPPGLRVRWLSTEADWNSRLMANVPGARAALERIITEFPQAHEAFEARRRLFVLEIESSVRQRIRGRA